MTGLICEAGYTSSGNVLKLLLVNINPATQAMHRHVWVIIFFKIGGSVYG